jgi:hypothetical protein
MIKEKTNVRGTVRDPGFYSRSLLLVGLTLLTRQFRSYDLRVIQGRDQITMAAQVSTKKRRLAPVPPTPMRKDDQRVDPGLGCSVAHSRLTSLSIA